MKQSMLIEPAELRDGSTATVFDCRYSLADPQEGARLYRLGHVPGAHYLDLNLDLSGPVGEHGGRHPLPDPAAFAGTLARHGVEPDTEVVAYDDSRLGFAARLWWLMKSLGYRPPRLLNGGYQCYLGAGGRIEQEVPTAPSAAVPGGAAFSDMCDIHGLRQLQGAGALLVDSREKGRYQGLEEPIDPVAGHIPGALNRPWQGVTDMQGRVVSEEALRGHWGELLDTEQLLVVYCGSGVTACVNLFSLALLGRDDGTLYAGSWSDWCSYL